MLTGKTAIVTGGARGIGAGIARVLASQGARVAVLDLDGAEAEKTALALPTPGLAVGCDVAVEAETVKALRAVVDTFGGLDIVVNNAGVGRGASDPNVPRAAPGSLGSGALSAAQWDEYLSQNLRTTFVTTSVAAERSSTSPRSPDWSRRPGCRPTRRPKPASFRSPRRWRSSTRRMTSA